jgi:predicted nucleotidyltransferase
MMALTPPITKKINELANVYHLSLVVLFGSQSTGHTHAESDIDVAYVAEHPLTVEQEVHLNYELTNTFQIDRVDTVNIHHAPPLLMRRIFDEGTPLYQKTGQEFFRYRLYAMRRFIEAQPLYAIRRNELHRPEQSTL